MQLRDRLVRGVREIAGNRESGGLRRQGWMRTPLCSLVWTSVRVAVNGEMPQWLSDVEVHGRQYPRLHFSQKMGIWWDCFSHFSGSAQRQADGAETEIVICHAAGPNVSIPIAEEERPREINPRDYRVWLLRRLPVVTRGPLRN